MKISHKWGMLEDRLVEIENKFSKVKSLAKVVDIYINDILKKWDREDDLPTMKWLKENGYGNILYTITKEMRYNEFKRYIVRKLGIKNHIYFQDMGKDDLVEFFNEEIMKEWNRDYPPPVKWIEKMYKPFMRSIHQLRIKYNDILKESGFVPKAQEIDKKEIIKKLLNYYKKEVLPKFDEDEKITIKDIEKKCPNMLILLRKNKIEYAKFKRMVILDKNGIPLEKIVKAYDEGELEYINLNTLEDFARFYKTYIDPDWEKRGRALTINEIIEKEYGGFINRLRDMCIRYNTFVKEGLGVEPNNYIRQRYKRLAKMEDFVEFYKTYIDPDWEKRGRALTMNEIKEKGYSGFIDRLYKINIKYNVFVREGLGVEPNNYIRQRYKRLAKMEDFVEFYDKYIDNKWRERGRALRVKEIKEKGYSGFINRLRKVGIRYNTFVKEGLGVEPNNGRRLKTMV